MNLCNVLYEINVFVFIPNRIQAVSDRKEKEECAPRIQGHACWKA